MRLLVTEDQVQKLLLDNSPQHFSHLNFGLLVTRMKGVYKHNPSQATLQRCTREINTFLQRPESISSTDAAVLDKLLN